MRRLGNSIVRPPRLGKDERAIPLLQGRFGAREILLNVIYGRKRRVPRGCSDRSSALLLPEPSFYDLKRVRDDLPSPLECPWLSCVQGSLQAMRRMMLVHCGDGYTPFQREKTSKVDFEWLQILIQADSIDIFR